MKKKKIVKWFGFFILIFGLVEYWRIKDIGEEINNLDIHSKCYQNNDFIEYNIKIVYNNYAAIAQLDRAFDYESKGCKFESC